MFIELRYFLKRHFQQSNNGLVQLILLNGLVFVGLLFFKVGLVLVGWGYLYRLWWSYLTLPSPWESFLQQPWSMLTYFWLHDGFFNLVWHLLFLYSFGQLVLYRLTSKSLVLLYVLGGLGGGLCFLLLYNLASGFQGIQTKLIGPASSLYAVMAGAAFLLPDFYFQFFLIGRIKVKYIVGILLLLSLFELAQYQASGVASLSGALIGYLYVRGSTLFLTWKNLLIRFFSRFIRRTGRLQVTYSKDKNKPTQPVTQSEKQSVVDQILDKVAKSGYESLTKEEKRQLFEAGK
jgi:membrane associated rhomboid family serine protease